MAWESEWVDAKFDCPDTARQIMTTTFVDWLKAVGCELEGEVVSSCLEVSFRKDG